MKQHRSFAERYIEALNEFNSSEGKPNIEIIKELHEASKYLEEYSLLNISSLCDLMSKVSGEVDEEDMANLGSIINELAVLSHNAMETRNNTERMISMEAVA